MLLDAAGNLSRGMIARLLEPSDVAVCKWVRKEAGACLRLLAELGVEGRVFLTDDWDGFDRCIPEDERDTGKDPTFASEQDNSNPRHYLARFHRRSTVTSRSQEMVDLSPRLLHHLTEAANFFPHQKVTLSVSIRVYPDSFQAHQQIHNRRSCCVSDQRVALAIRCLPRRPPHTAPTRSDGGARGGSSSPHLFR